MNLISLLLISMLVLVPLGKILFTVHVTESFLKFLAKAHFVYCVLQVLLELGADPRIYADDGAIPQQVGMNV